MKKQNRESKKAQNQAKKLRNSGLFSFIALVKGYLLCFSPFYLSGAIILHLCIGLLGNEVE